MRIIQLNASDLEDLIQRYETKYQASTVEILTDQQARATIPEDDLLEWEAYVNQRAVLRECGEYVRHSHTQRTASRKH